MKAVDDNSIDLVVTSPPYPMIGMWDEQFGLQDSRITEALANGDGDTAFDLIHQCLDKVWDEVWRVTKEGGIVCINIGDATRSCSGEFKLYPNHARIQTYLTSLGFSALPGILWQKQTNTPNKFMGSGMVPPNAYITLEHEHILIFRKGNKRVFGSEKEKQARHESVYFWEERNRWFSDCWDLKGVRQDITGNSRSRSGAFPLEIAQRLILMFSIQGDTVLDPFGGTGTTSIAAILTQRNSVMYEVESELVDAFKASLNTRFVDTLNGILEERKTRHEQYVKNHPSRQFRFECSHPTMQKVKVYSKQETGMAIRPVLSMQISGSQIVASYQM